jgi:hypothetical protein
MIRMELIDKPRIDKFNFPGLQDRSIPMIPVVIPVGNPVVEEKKKKEKKEFVPTGNKKLNLTRPKHF